MGLAAALQCAAVAPANAELAEAGDIMVRLRAIDVIPQEDGNVNPIGGSVDIDNAIMPELDITYFLHKKVALELILAAAKHDVQATAGPIDLGSVWLLPPTLTLQYHFDPVGKFHPYAGFGVNYTMFFDLDEPAGLNLDYDNRAAFALQAGVDYDIGDNWFVNVDVKKVFLDTEVVINGGAITADVDIDPWIVGIGLGKRFSID